MLKKLILSIGIALSLVLLFPIQSRAQFVDVTPTTFSGGPFTLPIFGPTQASCATVTYSFTGRTTTGLNSQAASTWSLCGGGTLGLDGNTTSVTSYLPILPSATATSLGNSSHNWNQLFSYGGVSFYSAFAGSLSSQIIPLAEGQIKFLDGAGNGFAIDNNVDGVISLLSKTGGTLEALKIGGFYQAGGAGRIFLGNEQSNGIDFATAAGTGTAFRLYANTAGDAHFRDMATGVVEIDSTLRLGSTGTLQLSGTDDTHGILRYLARGPGADEDLTIDGDTTANVITWDSTTGVNQWNLTAALHTTSWVQVGATQAYYFDTRSYTTSPANGKYKWSNAGDTTNGCWDFTTDATLVAYDGDCSSAGNLYATGYVEAGANAQFFWAGRSTLQSTANKLVQVGDTSGVTGLELNGGTPTLGTCTGGSMTSGSHNTAGEVTGNTSGSCTINFGTPNFTNAPFCTINDEGSLTAARVSARSASAITVTGVPSGEAFQFICIGRIGT